MNEVHGSRRTWRAAHLKREERPPADGGRTPSRDDATPQRGREHPASTPSPAYLGAGSLQGVLEEQARWCAPQDDMSCGLFGSPVQGRIHKLGNDEVALNDGPSVSPQQPRSTQHAHPWACAACTLVNASDATRCIVCDALKGSTLPSAATLAVQRCAKAAPPAKSRTEGI